jgi:glycosyltransferase involved in cell wall biosynthesis
MKVEEQRTKNNYNFSIIIPHKNIPKLLQRCLDSIPQRDDLEVIVVDDNSDPQIVDFENFPGKKRKDTTIIFDKSGKGAGRARNVGIERAQGKWLLFADADDLYKPGFMDVLDEYKDDDIELLFYNVDSVDGRH